MAAFIGLLVKEITLRRKSVCAILVHLIPVGLILMQVGLTLLGKIFPPKGKDKEQLKAYLLEERTNVGLKCQNYLYVFHTKHYINGLEEDEEESMYNVRPSDKYGTYKCSFGSDRCAIINKWEDEREFINVSDVNEVIQATRNRSLNNLCKNYKPSPPGQCEDGIVSPMSLVGLHMIYDDEDNQLNLTYYLGHEVDSDRDKDLAVNLKLFHFAAMEKAYLKLTDASRTKVFLNYVEERAPFGDNLQWEDVFPDRRTGHSFVIIYSMISLIVPVHHILFEKRSKLKDLMHMSGVGNFKYYASYFLIDVVILLALNFLQLLLNTPATLEYYVVTAVYSVAVTLFSIALSVFFTSEALGLTLFSLVLVFDFLRSFVVIEVYFNMFLKSIPDYVQLLMAIYPSFGLKIAFDQLDNRRPADDKGKTLKLNNLQLFKFDWDNNPAFLQPQFIIMSLLVSWLFYNFVIFYVGEVWPWQSGTPRSLLFPLAKLRPSIKSKRLDPDKNAGSPDFESEPSDLKIGIQVNNLRKRYGFTKLVLKGVFLKVFHGQISVLLGHNGAGKTTLMSIITGLESSTSGKVLINGVDVDYEPTKARKGIGLCPQTNIQYDNLSVWDHLKFFAMLKGFPQSKLNQEIYRILDLVKLTYAHSYKSKSLSGGMKRRLQLGMAFIGGSRILILDEPSSGLDVEARRVVWDMLLAVKREYLIFMTTHHMEEADCLGDRVIIMHDGEIRCIGSPMFLKKVYGIGLTLRVSKGDNFQSMACLEFIQQYLKSATLTKETRTEVLYVFAKTEEPNLPQFLKDLDPMRAQLGITSCGVAITTMDDVFVQIGEKYDARKADFQGLSTLNVESGQKSLKPTFCNSFYGLLVKRFHVTKRSKLFYVLLILSCLFSILFCFVFLRSSFHLVKGYKFSFELDDKYGYTCLPKNSSFCNEIFSDALTDESKQSVFTVEVKNDTASDSNSKCLLLTPERGHELGAITETFRRLLNGTEVQIRLNATQTRMVYYFPSHQGAPFIIIFFGVLLHLIPFRAVLAEKRTNVKLLQLMTGVSPVTYWLANFVFDYLLALVISLPMLVLPPIFYITSDGYNVFNEISSAVLYYLGFLYFIFSSLIWSYLASNVPFGPAAGIQILIYSVFIELVLHGQGLKIVIDTQDSKFPTNLVHYVFLLIYWLSSASPFSQFVQILISVFQVSDKRKFCKNWFTAFDRSEICNGQVYWTKLSNMCCNATVSADAWKELYAAKAPSSDHEKSIKYSFVIKFLVALIVLMLFTLLILGLEYLNIVRKKRTSQVRHSVGQEDPDVLSERMTTEKVLAENGQINKALLVKDLTKKYGPKFVVNRLTVTVEKNQIFGFLGVNGAGKTTSFKMMVGEISRTGGEAYIEQYSLSRNFQKYRAQIGYCPQFDSFVTGLTGEEMLYLFARLRGIQRSQIKQTVNQMVSLVDLQDYAKVIADKYSGGNKRKLSAALALIGYPKVIFLDEPTAAVDPVARRKIWKVMEYAKQATGSSIVLTSHALDECEALCEKIVVMVAGQLKCLGSLQHLKEKFGQGLHITAKTKPGLNNLPQVQETILKMVPSSKVVDSHTNIAILHVTDPQVQIGDVYGVMEQIKAQFDLEDYQVEETNLEQIFLYFAKAAYK